MQDPQREHTGGQAEMTTASANSAARYGVGPSKGRSNAIVSAPGAAETVGHQGVPEEEKSVAVAEPLLVRAADEAALRRVARRRTREDVQRKERVDVRYSIEEKCKILAKAASMNIAGAHLVGASVMAYLDGELTLPGQRTPLDDYIDELTAFRTEVAKIGHNVNQIARKLNSGSHPHPGDASTLAQAERTLTTVCTAVRQIAAATNQAAIGKAAG
ncbi:plasmid mobilization relaxosome protein MobC [Streptomyces sp. NPDC051018]|uniref:plasmid mobilization relaxosome protein MobC n=1 Tax=Streptomyces sp. NPDC051018 TaxID=3365639 RepID=UPI0037A04A74